MKGKKSIRKQLMSMGILPIVTLGVLLFSSAVVLMYSMYSSAIREELETSTYILKGCFDLTVRGDYTYERDVLKKGDVNISDSTMLYEIKDNSDVDTTIFYGDTRIMTTVENSYGVSAVGTKANTEIACRVLDEGENYFSENVDISDMRYIGYYTPLMNDDGTVIGMVFAGKPKIKVYRSIANAMIVFLFFTLLVLMAVSIIWKRYSKSLITDVGLIKSYLHTITDGNLAVTMDERIVQREDEIGEIGIYAEKMCGALKSMVELDPLTQLYNRRTSATMLQNLVEEGKEFTVAMGDIDFFKGINDNYGHACGDYILKGISALIQENVRECGFASRWGGEEFLLIYELEPEKAKEKVEVLLEAIRNKSFAYEEEPIRVTMTIGVKERDCTLTYEKAIQIADDNLYKGKKNGRNQIVY